MGMRNRAEQTIFQALIMVAGTTGLFAGAARAGEPKPLLLAQVIEDAVPSSSAPRASGLAWESRGNPASPEEIRAWIRDLGDPVFEVREEATRKLEHCGAEAVPLLLAAIERSDGLEVIARSIRGLQGILDYGDEEAFDAAERELEKLADSRNPSIARRAAAALEGQNLNRRRQAIARIRKLGGIVRVTPREMDPFREPGASFTDDEENITGQLHVILSTEWKGGDAGLVNVRRLGGPPWFRLPEVYITTTSKVSPPAIAELQRRVPGLEPITRGGAMLGVSFPSQEPCIVGAVQPGSGAERAGLRQGDIIATYDGVPLKNLKHLTDITGTHSPGDKVVLEIMRDGNTLKVEVELTAWK